MRRLHIIILLLLLGLFVPRIGITDAAAQVTVRLSDRRIEIRGQQYLIHKVSKGETLYAISKAYGVGQDNIMEANSLTRDVLKNKQTLLIPVAVRKADRTQTHTYQTTTPPTQTQTEVRPPQRPAVQQRMQPTRPAVGTGRQVIHSKSDTIVPMTATATPPLPEQQTLGETTRHDTYNTPYGNGQLRDFDPQMPLNIAVLLPLQAGSKSNDNFSDFYKGVLLGLNALKVDGVATNVRFMNSGASPEKVQDLIRSGKLQDASLIIGPVYSEAFAPVAEYAAQQGVAVVSPLGTVGAEGNPYVFEAAPAESCKYDKIFSKFGNSRNDEANIILIDHQEYPDTAALAIIEAHFGEGNINSMSYTGVRSQTSSMTARLNSLLDKGRENIIYIPVNRVSAVEEILSRISSANTLGRYKITVIGTPRWGWLSNLNLDLFFKLNVHYPTSYHADRSDPAVAEFFQEYVNSFGTLPSPYSYRGYDVVRYFGSALQKFGSEMPGRITSGDYSPKMLQVDYDYRQKSDGGKYRNQSWPVVNYRPDYSIVVK